MSVAPLFVMISLIFCTINSGAFAAMLDLTFHKHSQKLAKNMYTSLAKNKTEIYDRKNRSDLTCNNVY